MCVCLQADDVRCVCHGCKQRDWCDPSTYGARCLVAPCCEPCRFAGHSTLSFARFVCFWLVLLQPLADIGRLCRKKKVFFHTDVAQMTGKVRFLWRIAVEATDRSSVLCAGLRCLTIGEFASY